MGDGEVRGRTIKLTIAYEGAAYVGWQAQENGPSIQEQIEGAIHAVTGETLRVEGSGRTDAGVHARGQMASFVTSSRVPVAKLARALSAHLPEDIAVLAAEPAPDDFHARRSATGKVYRYTIHNGPVRPVFERRTAAFLFAPLDETAMRAAAAFLAGKHDFSAFVTERSERTGSCVRTIRRLDVNRAGPMVEIEVEGDGFLYNMVRAIAGSLMEVGRGKYPPSWLKEVLDSRDRRRAGPTAPAHGLCLERVLYES